MSLAALAMAAAVAATPEHWLGQIETAGRTTVLHIDCPASRTAPCTVEAPAIGGGASGELQRPATDDQTWRLTLGGEAIALAPASSSRDIVRGAAPNGGRFELRRLSADFAHALDAWTGLYRARDGRAVGVGRFGEFGDGLFVFDYAGGASGPLIPFAGGARLGAAMLNPMLPATTRVWAAHGALAIDGVRYARVPIARQAFTLARGGGVTLAGELDRPAIGRPRGVLVLVHGSGPGPRSLYDPWRLHFLSRGWAVVVVDKRGSGRSGGDWHAAGFDCLASDIEAAVAWARKAPSLRGAPLGLWGISQAGWILPIVADDVAPDFMIVQSGALGTPKQDALESVEAEMRGYDFPNEEIAKAKAYYALDVDVSRGVRPWSEIDAAYRTAQSAGAEWLLAPPQPADSSDRTLMHAIADFDPESYWRRLHTPTLALFGDRDRIVPAAPNVQRLQALKPSGVRVVTLADDNHLGMLAKTGLRSEYPALNRFDPAYFAAVDAWLARFAR
jgi:hypothetical protein